MYQILTFDIESNLGEKEIIMDIPKLLNILSLFPKIKCTFNVAAHAINISKKNIQRIVDEGHEVAAHGYKHDMNWNVKPFNEQEKLIIKAKNILESGLETSIVGWATPVGNKHSANVELLKKHGFIYVRDKSYLNYYQFVPLKVSDGFVELVRFGYDESGFMKRNFVCNIYRILNLWRYDKPMVFCNILRYYPDWTSQMIYEYLKNMYLYKKHVECSYLINNLHPARIVDNKELEKAFIDYLEFISKDKDIEILRARDFAKKLIDKEINLSKVHRTSQNNCLINNNLITKNEDLIIVNRNLIELAIIFNSSIKEIKGKTVIEANLPQILILKMLKANITKKYGLIYDWNKEKIKYEIDIKSKKITLDLNIPAFSTSKICIGKIKHEKFKK